MKRRLLNQWLGVAPLLAGAGAWAQTKGPCRVAWVSMDSANANSPMLAAFRGGLAELGYTEGKNLTIDAWWADGSVPRLEQMRDDILRRQPDVIVAQGGVALGPMRHASVTVPVVFGMSADPVEAKFATSYAHPGGNFTGITLFAAEMAGKRLAFVREVLPAATRVAVIANPLHPGAQRELKSARDAAAGLGLQLSYFPTPTTAELESALAEIVKARAEAVLVFSDGFALANADRLAAFSLQHRIPVAAGWTPFAQRGSLLAYGPQFVDVYRRLATFVDRIHRGARPGDLPIEQPTKIELVLNLKTAKALGLQMPRAVLLRADEVIQ
jgi:putative tryptophan/tyrosine transport system substrate-binding protein